MAKLESERARIFGCLTWDGDGDGDGTQDANSEWLEQMKLEENMLKEFGSYSYLDAF